MKAAAAFIVSAVRTPIGKYGGSLRDLSTPDLGVVAARAALSWNGSWQVAGGMSGETYDAED